MRKIRLLILLFVGAALMWGPVSLQAMDKEANTIDELVSMFDESSCIDCHEEIHNQWSDSWHAQSVVSSLGSITSFIENGLKKEWETEVTKGQMLKCLDCHAPVINYASEKLAVEIAEMIVTAAKEKGKPAGDAAKKELAKLRVGCLSCHNLKALAVAPHWNGPREEGMIYGPHGEDAAAVPLGAEQARRHAREGCRVFEPQDRVSGRDRLVEVEACDAGVIYLFVAGIEPVAADFGVGDADLESVAVQPDEIGRMIQRDIDLRATRKVCLLRLDREIQPVGEGAHCAIQLSDRHRRVLGVPFGSGLRGVAGAGQRSEYKQGQQCQDAHGVSPKNGLCGIEVSPTFSRRHRRAHAVDRLPAGNITARRRSSVRNAGAHHLTVLVDVPKPAQCRYLPIAPQHHLACRMKTSSCVSVTFRRRESFENIRDRDRRQVGKLAGIEIRAMAGTAFLVPDVRLLRIHQPVHVAAAARAAVLVDRVPLLSLPWVADIDRRCRFPVAQDFQFSRVEPEALAVRATINLGAVDLDLVHVGPALRAAHRAGEKQAGAARAHADRVTRRGLALHVGGVGMAVAME